MDARNRIREMFPGDNNKKLRHHLYSKPDFLASNPSDQQITEEAEWFDSQESGSSQEEEPPAPPLDPESAAKAVHQAMTTFAASAAPVVVRTGQDYEEAAKGFAAIKQMLKDLEAKRKTFTAPLNEALDRINAEFKASKAILDAELLRYESPMTEFKRQEREQLRQAEQDRQIAIQRAQEEAQKRLDESKARLEALSAEEDSFLAALDRDEIREDVHTALVDIAMAPQRIQTDAPAPAMANGTRTVFAWKAEIVNEDELDRSLLEPSTKRINALVKLLKAQCNNDITKLKPQPGLRIYEDCKVGGR